MNISERFAALPRARRGETTVIIVDEEVLAALIGDAQASEAALVGGDWPTRGNRDYELHGRPTVMNVITPPSPPEVIFVDRPRHGPGRRW